MGKKNTKSGSSYYVKLVGHVPWARDVINLSQFKKIRPVFRPILGRTEAGDKYHQLRYELNRFILQIIMKSYRAIL